MTEKFKILGQYIKDMSSETPDVETFLFVKDNISKYQLGIDITSKAIKNKIKLNFLSQHYPFLILYYGYNVKHEMKIHLLNLLL